MGAPRTGSQGRHTSLQVGASLPRRMHATGAAAESVHPPPPLPSTFVDLKATRPLLARRRCLGVAGGCGRDGDGTTHPIAGDEAEVPAVLQKHVPCGSRHPHRIAKDENTAGDGGSGEGGAAPRQQSHKPERQARGGCQHWGRLTGL